MRSRRLASRFSAESSQTAFLPASSGSALADEITTKLEDDGSEPEGITCPDTAKVGKDITTVCHGTDFGDEAAFVVFFEDDEGAYTLMEV